MTDTDYKLRTIKNVITRQPIYITMLITGVFATIAAELEWYRDPNLAFTIGIALISSSFVGLVMAWQSDRIASKLHERLDEQNEIMESNHKEVMKYHKESLKKHDVTISLLKEILNVLREIKEKIDKPSKV